MKSKPCISLSVTLVTCAFVFSLISSAASARGLWHKPKPFDGAWACSSSVDHLPFGDGARSLAGLSRTVIDDNSASNEGIAAVEMGADDEVVVESNSHGYVEYLGKGMIEIKSTLTSGTIKQDTVVRCIGMGKLHGRFQEMHCLDLTDEGAGNNQVSLAICKRQ